MITLKPLRLILGPQGSSWIKRIELLDGTEIRQELNVLLPEMLTESYFDGWEAQILSLPFFNIVEVLRLPVVHVEQSF